MKASDVLTIATKEIGYTESPTNSNKTKYGEAYGWNGVAWCMIFMWWCFDQAGASDLFYGGAKTASCGELKNYAIAHNQWVTSSYQPGDLVIMDFPNTGAITDHVGIVESVKGTVLTTIEGNTSPSDIGSQYNGGCVARKTRDTTKVTIVGAYRPQYKEEEMTQTEFNVMFKTAMADYQDSLRDNDAGVWSEAYRKWAIEKGLFEGNDSTIDGQPNMMWESPLTREQAAKIFNVFYEMILKDIKK